MYAAIFTRPDFSFAVQHLSQFFSNPGMAHWQAVNRVLRYLHGSNTYGVTLDGSAPDTIKFFGVFRC